MSLRRLHHEQPDSFAFTPANAEWAKMQIAKYPEGRQASAVIPLLWRAQEQEGWVTQKAIEEVAAMLDMAEIRVLEVATFYFMFQLKPVGEVAHIQVCGTTSCMICGAEDLVEVCKEKIAPSPHQISADGKFSWEEVECLGACSNAPMAQIGKDYYEDLTTENFSDLIDRMGRGELPKPGPQNGRWASEPITGRTSLKGDAVHKANASADIAGQLGDTLKRIDGTDPLPDWNGGNSSPPAVAAGMQDAAEIEAPADQTLAIEDIAATANPSFGDGDGVDGASDALMTVNDHAKPILLTEAGEGGPDDLKLIKGIGPKLERTLNDLGIFHFDQIATWTEREVGWVDERLKFKGRIERDGWIDQAKILAAGADTGFSSRD
ncbi:MAG: NADH-quinone oxidoreductase subunit E [Pseudomonadota bacterium]